MRNLKNTYAPSVKSFLGFYINYEEFKEDIRTQCSEVRKCFILTMRNLKICLFALGPGLMWFYINYEEFKEFISIKFISIKFSFILTMRNLKYRKAKLI